MEKEYWNLIREGDNKAFSELYNTYADSLYGYGMKIAGDSEMVEDMIQNVFIKLFERSRSLTCPDSIKVYLYASLKHTILNELQKARPVTVPLDEGIGGHGAYDFQLEIDPCSRLEQDEEEQERQQVLQDILDGLDGKQREIIYLRFYKGMSTDEVAAIFNTNNQQIYKATSRIIKRLKEKNVYDKAFIALVLMMQNW